MEVVLVAGMVGRGVGLMRRNTGASTVRLFCFL